MALDPARLNEIVQPYATVSDRIRALDAAGVPRADIARFLGKRYQHVRNVLEGDAVQGGGGGYVLGKADLSGVRENTSAFDQEADDRSFIESRGNGAYRLEVRPDGSVLLPKEILEAFGAKPGSPVMARLDGEEFKLIGAATAMRRVRALVRKHAPAQSGSVVDEFLAERRAMWGEDD